MHYLKQIVHKLLKRVFDALVLAIILSSRYLSLRHWLSSCVYDQNTWFDTLISIIGDVYLHIQISLRI